MNTPARRGSLVPWRVHLIRRQRGLIVCLGAFQVGIIERSKGVPMCPKPHFVGHLTLPGVHGPISRGDSEDEVTIEVSAAIRNWVNQLEDRPAIPADKEEAKPAPVQHVTRVRRTRS